MSNKIKQTKDKKRIPAKRVNTISVKAVNECSRLYPDRYISSPADIFDLTKDQLLGSVNERFLIVYMNTKNEPLAIHQTNSGTANSCLVDIPNIFRGALLTGTCTGFICVHNHPSGNPQKSTEDQYLTDRLVEASKLMNIEMKDHVIVGDNSYYSFKEEGLI